VKVSGVRLTSEDERFVGFCLVLYWLRLFSRTYLQYVHSSLQTCSGRDEGVIGNEKEGEARGHLRRPNYVLCQEQCLAI
jgi:hypothetical protein